MTDTAGEDAQGVGARLRQVMQDRGYSARRLAIELEERGLLTVTRTTIGHYLEGRFSPTVAQLLDIARVLRVRPEWLVVGRGSPYIEWTVLHEDEAFGWLPDELRERLRVVAMRLHIDRVRHGVDADGEVDRVTVMRSALLVSQWLRAAMLRALAIVGSPLATAELEERELGQRLSAAMSTQSFNDTVLLLVLALERMIEVQVVHPISGAATATVTAAGTLSAAEPTASVAPSVATGHITTEPDRTGPKRKRG